MIEQYLTRIGIPPETRRVPDLLLLAELQVAHMIHVPFENLDVFSRRGVKTDTAHSLDKVVSQGRGGWCFEINGAFGWLLGEMGFDVSYVSCRVFGDDGWGPELDHCGLVVQLEDTATYVDVGFGDNCMVPIPLTTGIHDGVPRQIDCQMEDDSFVLSELQLSGEWTKSLWGSLEPLSLTDFTPRSDYLQSEPGLSWTAKPFATRAIDQTGSRVTLRPNVLKTRDGAAEFVETPLDDADWVPMLADHFEITT